ncbi:hypothetical protein OROGR_032942 [Orobanche gracilis]
MVVFNDKCLEEDPIMAADTIQHLLTKNLESEFPPWYNKYVHDPVHNITYHGCDGVQDSSRDLNIEDINQIFLEVNPPDDKSFIYGWELGVSLSAPATLFSQGSRSRLSEERLSKELDKRNAEYLNLQ